MSIAKQKVVEIVVDKQLPKASRIFKDKEKNHLFFHNGNPEDKPEQLCGALDVISSAQKSDGSGWCLIVDITDREGVTKQLQIPYKDMSSAQEIKRLLLDAGFWVSTTERHGQLLAKYLNDESANRHCELVDRTGWHGDQFVTPCTSAESGYLLSNGQSCPPATGSQSSWEKEVAALCVGNSRLMFAVSMAFASPLLRPTKTDSAILHFEGASSIGKTTAAKCFASVSNTEVHSWKSTGNGIEALCKRYNGMGLILDELGEADPNTLSAAFYCVANGRPKLRAQRDSTLKVDESWSMFTLSTGERSAAESLLTANQKLTAGQAVRVNSIQADAGNGYGLFDDIHGRENSADFADELNKSARDNCGIVFGVFIYWLTEGNNLTDTVTLYESIKSKFIANNCPQGNAQIKRVASKFALIATAGEAATTAKITGWDSGAAIKAAEICFHSWLLNSNLSGSTHEAASAIDDVVAFLQQHSSRFDDHQRIEGQTPNRAGYTRNDGGTVHYYVFPKVYREEICNGHSVKAVSHALLDGGFLDVDERLNAKMVSIADKKTRLYRISSEVLEHG